MDVKRAAHRALRTLIQNSSAFVTAIGAAVAAAQSFDPLTDNPIVWAAMAFVAVGGAVNAFLQNLIEDKTGSELVARD